MLTQFSLPVPGPLNCGNPQHDEKHETDDAVLDKKFETSNAPQVHSDINTLMFLAAS